MHNHIIQQIRQKGLGHLTALCARPGDGRLSITMGLANALAADGETVCFCSFSQGKTLKKHVPLPSVQVLPPAADDLEPFFEQLHEVLKLDTFLFVDNLTAMVLTDGNRNPEKKAEVLSRLRDMAVGYGAHVVVSDMFAHGWDGDDRYPIPPESLRLCDRAYIAYKESVSADDVDSTKLPVIQLKEIARCYQ